MTKRKSPFAGRRAVLATMHGKEQTIAPVFLANLRAPLKIALTLALRYDIGVNRLCCTNRLGDSFCESSVVAEGHEQTQTTDLQDPELASLQ